MAQQTVNLVSPKVGAINDFPQNITQVNDDGSTNVFTQDYPFPPVEHYLYNVDQAVTIVNGPYALGTNVIELAAGHGFTAPNRATFTEDFIVFKSNDPTNFILPQRFLQSRVVDVVGNSISLGIPLTFNLNTTDIISIERVTVDLNTTIGTLADPIEYETSPPSGQLWHLTRLMPVMICGSQPDDSLFGNIPSLPNGITFSVESPGLITESLINIIDNSEWAATCYDLRYSDRSVPQGSYGVNSRKTFSGRDKWGIIIRLGFLSNQRFFVSVQDDLTDLLRFRIKIMGRTFLPKLI